MWFQLYEVPQFTSAPNSRLALGYPYDEVLDIMGDLHQKQSTFAFTGSHTFRKGLDLPP